jgi:hypothetical protein
MATGKRVFEDDFATERLYWTAELPALSIYPSYPHSFWPDHLSECIEQLLSKDSEKRPSAGILSKKFAAYDTMLQLPGMDLILLDGVATGSPVQLPNFTDGFTPDSLFSIVKDFLPAGLDYTSFLKIMARSIQLSQMPWANRDLKLDPDEATTQVVLFWTQNPKLVAQVVHDLMDRQEHEAVNTIFDWVVSPHKAPPRRTESVVRLLARISSYLARSAAALLNVARAGTERIALVFRDTEDVYNQRASYTNVAGILLVLVSAALAVALAIFIYHLPPVIWKKVGGV